MNGIINVYKPVGMTSHDVVYRLRKILNIKKIGHTGTLDPDASGVLPMCIGRATKTADMLTAADKQYRAEVTLGSRTDTLDASGAVLETAPVNVTEVQVIETVSRFIGEIEQIPPMYSAIKIDGKKLYELAREGKEIERKPRQVTISNIEVLELKLDKQKFEMLVDCSKGTYIRTLCDDIGMALGCFAHMSALERTRSGRFNISGTVTLEEIETRFSNDDIGFLIPIDEVFAEYEKIVLAENKAKKLCNGTRVPVAGIAEGDICRVYNEHGEFLVIAQMEDGTLKILKTFYQI